MRVELAAARSHDDIEPLHAEMRDPSRNKAIIYPERRHAPKESLKFAYCSAKFDELLISCDDIFIRRKHNLASVGVCDFTQST